MERIRSFSSRCDREVRIGLGNRQRRILNNQPKSILPLMVTLSSFPLTRWPICSNVTAALSENTFETFSKKMNSKRNQCGQNLPTLPLMEKHTTWIRTIFEQYVNTDTGANGLSKYLETHGFQKLARQNGTSPLFSATLIRAILKNPVYCGKIAFGRRKLEKIQV